MDGTWIWFERYDNWHLVTQEDTVDGPDGPEVRYTAWCGLMFDKSAPRKATAAISQWADTLHDACYQKSQEEPTDG